MRKVIVRNPQEKIGFILFNYLYSQKKDDFTLKDLKTGLNNEYNLNITEEDLQNRINAYIRNGMVMRTATGYRRQSLV